MRFQNRVNRNGIAIVPYRLRDRMPDGGFENGYWIEVRPDDYWDDDGEVRADFDEGVEIGRNAYVFYETRDEWERHPPPDHWQPMPGREGGGHYVVRVYGVNAGEGGEPISAGAPTGMGIRFYEYASREDNENAALQLGWLAWHTEGADPDQMSDSLREIIEERDLGDIAHLAEVGTVTVTQTGFVTVCPLCQRPIRLTELMTNVEQAEGREVAALRITEANLFHLRDLRPGEYNHRPYLLGWGHHRCNVAAADQGIVRTVEWMAGIIEAHAYGVERPHRVERAPD